MGYPVPFSTKGGAIASYEWLDITSGVGYRTYYGFKENTATADYSLVTTSIFDSGGYIRADMSTVDATYIKGIDIDFDIVLARPAYVQGLAYFNCTVKAYAQANCDGNHYVVATLVHYDGSTETELASAQSETTNTPESSTEYFRHALVLDVTAGKKFKIGETLRLTVEVWGNDTQGTMTFHLFFDPSSRLTVTDHPNGATTGTDLKLHVPFRVDI